MSTTVQLRVTGMTCGGCENAVQRALGRTPGVERVDASHREASVAVVFDEEKTTVPELAAAITALGYQVESRSA